MRGQVKNLFAFTAFATLPGVELHLTNLAKARRKQTDNPAAVAA
jgi:hypothetical protein